MPAPNTPPPRPVAFRTAARFRAWLQRHHATATELRVRLFKVHAAHRGMTYKEALDEALSFGWIDGVRHGLDTDSFAIRFTPRRPSSIWSAVNIRRVGELKAMGRMRPSGLVAFRARTRGNSRRYAYESMPVALPEAYARAFQSRKQAWAYFQSQPPSYRRISQFWVMSGKQQETRERRLALLIGCSQKRTRIPQLRPSKREPRPRRRAS